MDFNLSKLCEAVNSKFRAPIPAPCEFFLTDNKEDFILAKIGEVAYFFDYVKLVSVLEGNGFDHYYKEDTQEKINDLLSKHIVNQLTAASGTKWYPEVKTVFKDINTND